MALYLTEPENQLIQIIATQLIGSLNDDNEVIIARRKYNCGKYDKIQNPQLHAKWK